MPSPNPDTTRRDSSGWRRLTPPVDVSVYIAQGWHDAVAVDINEDTREVRIEWPPRANDSALDLITHRVLDAALYRIPHGSL